MGKIERTGKILKIYLPKKELKKTEPLTIELIYGNKIIRYDLSNFSVIITENVDLIIQEAYKIIGKRIEDIINVLRTYEYDRFGLDATLEHVDITAIKSGYQPLDIIEEIKAKLQPLNCSTLSYHNYLETSQITIRCK